MVAEVGDDVESGAPPPQPTTIPRAMTIEKRAIIFFISIKGVNVKKQTAHIRLPKVLTPPMIKHFCQNTR
jgi:hypothetical protein